jgi:PAS domain S-box-containing protein
MSGSGTDSRGIAGRPDIAAGSARAGSLTDAVAYGGAIVITCVGLYLSSLYSYLLFHGLVEIVTIAIGFMLFVLVWNTQRFYSNGFLGVLGIGYGAIALLDLIHALAFKGMNVFVGFDSNLPTQLWIAARYLQAFTILAALLFVRRGVDNRVVVGVYAVVISAVTALVFAGWFPAAYIEGSGLTPFKVYSEYVITALLLLALYLFYRQRDHFDPTVFRLVAASILCTVLSEVSFTAYVSVYGFANLVGHILKLAAFYLIYRAILVTGFKAPFDLIFRELSQAKDALREVSEGLERQVEARAAELVASEQKYKALIEAANDAVFIHEIREDGTPGPFIEVNEAASRRLGYSREELGRLGPEEIDDPRYRDRIRRVMEQLAEQGSAVFETVQIAKDGHRIPVEVSTRVVEIEGKRLMLSLVRDISERKQNEALRVAKQAAERANIAKSTFLANMSHEIRTPMNAILGFAQLMRHDEGLTEHQRHELDVINSSGEHLLALVNDVLEMSKIESGRAVANVEPFDLHVLIDDLESLFGPRARAKGLAFRVNRSPDVPRCVASDQSKLSQVLVNLLGNAIKFTQDGSVELRVGVVHSEDGMLRLKAEVQDTGCGIAAEDMDRLFGYFEQGPVQGQSESGTGLGLAISREFVRLLGGDIVATSQLGVGSTFAFELPIQEADATTVCAVEGSIVGLEPGRHPYRVLVVDDRPEDRELLCKMLEAVGFSVREASGGAEAISVVEEWRPQLILMDLRMPFMDGIEATRRIRALSSGADIAIIGVTASAFAETRQGMSDAGIDDFLVKPFRESQLLDKIGAALGLVYVRENRSAETSPDDACELDPAVMASLPDDLLSRIGYATRSADFSAIAELAGEVEQFDSSSACALRALAERFDAEHILAVLPGGGTS